jgi:hypothetical protein
MAYGHIAIIWPYGHICHKAIWQPIWLILVSMEQEIQMQQPGEGIQKIKSTYEKV